MAHMDNNDMPPTDGNNTHQSDDGGIYANLLTYDEAGDKLKRHRNTIANMVHRGELEKKKIGRTPYVFKDQVESFGKRNGK